MSSKPDFVRIETGVRNFDAIFGGGLPKSSGTVLSGPPGSGKSILAQQICFHNASEAAPVLHVNTLSEPTARSLLYLRQFSFFDQSKVGKSIHFVDIGEVLRSSGLDAAVARMTQDMKRVRPAMVVIDSFKVFDDVAKSPMELRMFTYELATTLMAWETTSLLIGEYGPEEQQGSPLFSIVDGLVVLSQRESSGEQQRFLRAVKMRGIHHSREEHPFVITEHGVDVFAPSDAIARRPDDHQPKRCMTHITKLDELLGPGIPWGSSFLISGVAGTGKTVLTLEFIYRGALAGEKGILFSFEETEERLRATAQGLGWDLDREIERGMVEIVFIPQPDIRLEAHLRMMQERISAMGARRVVIDSVSVFMHKVDNSQVARDRIFHLCSIVQNANAVGFFASDVPYGSGEISRFGVEETAVDGIIILTSTEEGFERQRYIEVYKLRNTEHLKGRHSMMIGMGGVSIYPRYEGMGPEVPPPIAVSRRIPSGVPGLDALLGNGLLAQSATLVSGSPGVGKTTIAMQFLLEGARRGEPGLFVTLEEGAPQILASAETLKLPLQAAVDAGTIEILNLSRAHIRTGQLLTILADKILEMKAERLVFDAVTHPVKDWMAPDEFSQVLYKLLVRFKSLGVTTLLTLEARSLYSTGTATDQALPPLVDNLLMLRYAALGDRLQPALTVIKTRGSFHEPGIYHLTLGEGGVRVSQAASAAAAR